MTDTSTSEDFGPFPGRPDHPDFEIMARIVRHLDAKSITAVSIKDTIEDEDVDSASVEFIAVQRALRMSGDPEVVSALARCWLEGIVVGVKLAKERDNGVED